MNSPKSKAQPAQDPRLAKWRDEKADVTVFLSNGTRIEGRIMQFDAQTILVDTGEPCLIYKTMILTISPPRRPTRARRGPGRQVSRRDSQPGIGRDAPRRDSPARDTYGREPYGRDGGRRDGRDGGGRDGQTREPRQPIVRYKKRMI